MRHAYEFMVESAPGQELVIKPGHLPDIQDNAHVEVYIDGRKAFFGDGKQYTVECEGLLVRLAQLGEQEIIVRYTQ